MVSVHAILWPGLIPAPEHPSPLQTGGLKGDESGLLPWAGSEWVLSSSVDREWAEPEPRFQQMWAGTQSFGEVSLGQS